MCQQVDYIIYIGSLDLKAFKDLHVSIRYQPMIKPHTAILLLLCIIFTISYDTLDTHQQIMVYYEENSFMPIMHVYYNRHFSKSRQFQNFIQTIEDTELQVGPYAKVLLTDCQAEKSDENMACKEIKRLNENRMIIGYQPTSKFTSFGDKIMQSPPQNKVFDHHSDTYTVEQFVRFINQLVPNFLKEIKNTHEFEEFKKPLYVPKLIFAAQEGEVPEVMKQLSVQFFLKFDMAYVQDLTETVVNMLQIKRFPSLMVLKHNFETGKLQIFHYDHQDFSEDQYSKIRKFLSKHALKQRRNDYVFHLIKMPKHAEIQTVDSNSGLDETLNRIQSWVFLQQGSSFSDLIQLKNKYGLFYDYVHHYKPDANESKVYLLNPRNNFKIEYDKKSIQYRLLNAENLQSNMTIWLKKDYVVMGVREQFGYLCTLVDKHLFAGLTQCFIIEENSYEQVTQNVNMKFKYGFVLSAKNIHHQNTKVNGNEIKTLNFGEIYRILEYTTRMKVKDIIDDFMDHPVKNLTSSTEVEQLCAQPYKKCILYFYEQFNDKTKLEYLELEARDFVNEYKIYSIDLSCNKHFYEEIPQFSDSHGGLIAYHPRINKYVYLKAKMTRNVIKKFLEINNQDKKSLPFKSFSTDRTPLNHCEEQTNQSQQEDEIQPNKQNQRQFVEQL